MSIAIKKAITVVLLAVLLLTGFPLAVYGYDNGLPDDYVADDDLNRDLNLNKYGVPVHQYKNVFESETVLVPDIDVVLEDELSYDEPYPVDEPVQFRVYNATTQETEQTVTVQDGKICGFRLKRGHAYMITSADPHYIVSNYSEYGSVTRLYLWALKAGDQGVPADGAYDYKTAYHGEDSDNYLRQVNEINLHYSSDGFYDPLRTTVDMEVKSGTEAVSGVRFVFTSHEEDPVTAISKDGKLTADLLEDVDYTVHVEDENYDIETYALAVKDKSEHKFIDVYTGKERVYGRYTYDHTCCQGSDKFVLISHQQAEATRNNSVDSLKKITGTDGAIHPLASVSGMNFKNLLLLVRNHDLEIPEEFAGKDCEITDYTLVNPHRWEICRITDVEMHVTQYLSQNKKVDGVYMVVNGRAEQLVFTQPSDDTVSFDVNEMPTAAIVIEYAAEEAEETSGSKPSEAEPAPVPVSVPETVVPAIKEKTDLPSVRIIKPKAQKKAAVIKWKKISKRNQKKIAGIEVQLAADKKFTQLIRTSKGKKSKTSLKLKKLKSRKTYWVRIRAYKNVGGVKHVSKWSAVKKVKIK